jgi:hypothetical protein
VRSNTKMEKEKEANKKERIEEKIKRGVLSSEV